MFYHRWGNYGRGKIQPIFPGHNFTCDVCFANCFLNFKIIYSLLLFLAVISKGILQIIEQFDGFKKLNILTQLIFFEYCVSGFFCSNIVF